MKVADPIRTYETTNVDLATFLMLQGIKFLDYKVVDKDKKVISLIFIDDKRNCTDLERVFINSDFKRFREINKYLLSKIHEKLREANKNE